MPKPDYDWHVDRDLIGKTIDYSRDGKPTVRGTVTGCRRSASQIYDVETGESWAGLQYRIKPDSGSRAFWTTTFADKSRPVTL